jgi:uncharacterized protein YndB with AHSA1/START domain
VSTPPATRPASAHEIGLTFEFNAPPDKVWRALVKETAAWWPAAFHTSPRTKRFVIEPKLGGMMGEVTGRGEGLTWYRVIGIEKPTSLLLAGHLFPPWAGPATSLLRLTLSPVSDQGTRLDLCDSIFGCVGDVAATTDGWKQIFAGHLKPYVSRSRRHAAVAKP